MKVKGLDTGYLYTKDNDRRIFRSCYSKSSIAMGSTSLISIDGVDFSVGAGDRTVDVDKTNSKLTEVCVLTNLAMTGSDDYNLVVGLPIGQFKSQKDKFKETILGYNSRYVVYRGEEMKIKINDAFVFPQGIGALMSLNDFRNDAIIFDFGGLTIDLAYIEMVCGNPVLIKYDTWTEGIQKIYSKLIDQVNYKFNLSLSLDYGEKILTNDLVINGVVHSKDFLLPTLSQYLEPILTEYQLNYPCKTTRTYLSGGSAVIFKDIFMKRFPNTVLVENSQFANAIGYYKVGCQKFGNPDAIKPTSYACINRR